MMTRQWTTWLSLALCGGIAAGLGTVPARAQQTCAALTITGHPSYPPVAWAAGDTIVGAAPELVRGIAAKLGVKTVTSKNFGTWEGAQNAARDGQADVIFGIYKNDARAQYLDYVDPPFMMDPVSVVVRKGAGFPFAEWSDLKGRKGVTNAGESYGNKFDAYIASDLTVARAAGVDKAFAALMAGQADYLIIGLYPGRDEARKLGIADKVEALPKEVESAPMYVAFSKTSKCGALQPGFATGIKTAVDDGAVRRLLDEASRAQAQ